MPIVVDRVKTYASAKTDAKIMKDDRIRQRLKELKDDKDRLKAELEANTLVTRAFEDTLSERLVAKRSWAGVVMAGFPWIG